MNILRQILCLKIITIIALATFFISTMSIREAQARHGVRCPCNFWAATFLAKSQARQLDRAFVIDECNLLSPGVEAFGIPTPSPTPGPNACALIFEVEQENSNRECEYIFQCPPFSGVTVGEDEAGLVDIGDDAFALGVDVQGLTSAEFDACVQTVVRISEWIFDQPCLND